jgi:hypothetical protein
MLSGDRFTADWPSDKLGVMRPIHWIFIFAAALALSSLVVVDADAAPTRKQRTQARRHADQGLKAFKAKDYQGSIDAFEAAEKLIHAPPHWLYIARSYRHLGKLLKARTVYRDLIGEKLPARTPKAFKKAQSTAGQELGALEKAIPIIAVEIDGPDIAATRVRLNGEPMADVAAEVDPGDYKIEAEADGYGPESQTITVEAGSGTTTVALTLASDLPVEPEEPDAAIPIVPIVIAGVGVAALVVGGVMGGLALGKADELKEACPSNPCATSNEKLADDANVFATVSTTMLVVGGVAVAAGGGWLIYHYVEGDGATGDSETDAVTVRPLLGPGFAGIEGSF